MTPDEEATLDDFHKWCADPFDDRSDMTIPDGYEKSAGHPRAPWDLSDMGIDAPPFEPVPCRKCGEASEPRWRAEFKREDDAPSGRGFPHGWDTGISLFIYECPEHGYFANEAQERGYGNSGNRRNGRVAVI